MFTSGTALNAITGDSSPWDKHRQDGQKVSELYKKIGGMSYVASPMCEARASRVANCANRLAFMPEIDEAGEFTIKFQKAYFCRVRFCPVCQWRRQMKLKAKFIQGLPALSHDFPSHRWIFLTLTVQNCDIAALRAAVTDMNAAFDRLTKRRLWPANGWIKSIEVTYAKNKQAHPHIHSLLLVPAGYFKGTKYLSQSAWSEAWQKALRSTYLPIVHVRACKAGKNGTFESALAEVVKYTVKPSDLTIDEEWFAELNLQTYKARSVSVCGVLKRYIKQREIDLIEAGEENNQVSDENPFDTSKGNVVFNWSGSQYST